MYSIYAQIILNNNSKSTDRIYTYGVGEEFIEKIKIGKRVKVNFARNKHIIDGLVVSLSSSSELENNKIKPIIDVIDDEVIIKEEMIKLCFWIRDRYICKYSDAIRLMIPAMMKYENNFIINVINSGFCEVSLNKKESNLFNILKDGTINLSKLKRLYKENDLYNLLTNLKDKNIIEIINEDVKKRGNYVKLIDLKEIKPIEEYNINKTINQIKVIEYLKKHGKTNINKLIRELNVSSAIINNLIKREILICDTVLYEEDEEDNIYIVNKVYLNDEQKNACNKIINNDKNVFLLHGVTGSGKTEVYMEVIEHYQKKDKQSIMLVPEISLTAQTIDRFKKRFGNKIAVFHSKLTKKEKFIQWNKVYNKEVDVIVGARSALFAPVRDLGVIIIDEEHEDSYKSSTSPKYDAIEVGIKMSVLLNAKLILGTATPSINTYNMALKGQIELIEMKNRAQNAVLPHIDIVDMSKELDKGNNTIISEALYESIKTSLNNKEQVILFLNKRGYSGFVSCKKCGHVSRCDRCDVSMTYHIRDNMLHCHYCGRTIKFMNKCPSCGSEKIEQFGAGTQHVEKLINHLFPNSIIERMDFDSMNNVDSYNNIYERFKNRKIDILIGTQMLAKGFDFPYVTTVGILSADAILNLPFYNASEKTFQLITQVSGRAGRGDKEGRVYIQTYEPNNFIINASKNNDYHLFINEELKLRKEFAFPPFINIINICTISKNEELAKKVSQDRYEELKECVKDLVKERSLLLYRPIPHNIYKVNNEYRINLYVKCSNYRMNDLKKIIRKSYMSNDIENIKISININTDTI
ncbi:MAG: primosomal protein N' [Tissierellia bacterium]|nr:primosomal protein N' [Tissierellia bacterium]MDD4781499.1 primosomal protein N' [Tissierellia bacterium]